MSKTKPKPAKTKRSTKGPAPLMTYDEDHPLMARRALVDPRPGAKGPRDQDHRGLPRGLKDLRGPRGY